ncbi:MAG TPA: AsmA family protein [Rhodopila sp.]|nr:AsmA family protein [Rhodopila sp.]
MSRAARRLVWIGIPILLLVLLVVFWRWDWVIPVVEARASAAVGRKVTIQHLHVGVGRVVTISADGVRIDNPSGWPVDDPPLAAIRRLTIKADVLGWIEGHGLVLPLVGLDVPQIYAAQTTKDNANFRLSTPGGGSGATVKIGDLRIADGSVHAVMSLLKADFIAKVSTEGEGNDARIVAQTEGRYAGQPITGKFVGGALLSLRDKEHPWPVDLALANGPTHVALKGTLQDPMAMVGADVTLQLSGPDMALLHPLTGFPIPKTPPYEISGKLDLHGLENISFRDIRGRLGSSDITGSITQKPGAAETGHKARPDITMDLHSTRVDLADLTGFIGGVPVHSDTRNATPGQRREAAAANKSSTLFPNTPIDVPRLSWADIHLHYRGAHIEGRNIPFDNLSVVLDIINGRIEVHPVSFGVGTGRLVGNVDLTPLNSRSVRVRADIRMQNLDVSRMMAATHTFQGAGAISGVGAIESTGNSLADLMGNGNGEVKMAMVGGDLSAVLVDLTGLQFGNALLSALGMPQKTPVQCFVSALALQKGLLDFKAMTLDTGEAITNVSGNLNLKQESIDLHLKTDSKHFSIGSLPTNINITGTFKNPSVRPGAGVAARAGAAAGLAVLFAPLAILPTVQFGTSKDEDQRCGRLLRQARSEAGGKALPMPERGASAR